MCVCARACACGQHLMFPPALKGGRCLFLVLGTSSPGLERLVWLTLVQHPAEDYANHSNRTQLSPRVSFSVAAGYCWLQIGLIAECFHQPIYLQLKWRFFSLILQLEAERIWSITWWSLTPAGVTRCMTPPWGSSYFCLLPAIWQNQAFLRWPIVVLYVIIILYSNFLIHIYFV